MYHGAPLPALEGSAGARPDLPPSGRIADDELRELMDPFADGEYGPQALVAPWPTVAAADICGRAVQHRRASWAQAQARWLGHRASSDRARGATALMVATLWVVVVVARTQVRAGPPPAWYGWASHRMQMVRRHLVQRNVSGVEALVSRMVSTGLQGGEYSPLSWRAAQLVAGVPIWELILGQWREVRRCDGHPQDPASLLQPPPAETQCLGCIMGCGASCREGLTERPADAASGGASAS
eukprot:12320067-Alexandrium_andersonii.AAC.1